MATKIERLFAKIAVVNEFLAEEELEGFIRECDAEGDGKHLSLKLVEKAFVTPVQFEAIARIHKQQLKKLSLSAPPGFYDVGISAGGSAPVAVETRAGEKPFYTLPVGEDEFLSGGILSYLKLARSVGASDLHVSAASEPFFRLHGRIIYIRQKPLTGEVTERLLTPILNEEQKGRLDEKWDLDFAYADEKLGRFRVNYYRQRHGLSACFRLVEDRVRTIEELGLPPAIANFTTHHQGIVLITGTAGCGKSTTLAALVGLINRTRKEHIIAVEEPIEYVHQSDKCNVTQREVRRHTKDFHYALRASLREDPDVIVVGEMRDLETISMAITAAETGHLVFGTLHTTNATRTVDRILDVFPPREQAQIRAMVSESLRGVISQQLVPRSDGRGRIPAIEILVATPAVANMIREFKTFQLVSTIQTGKNLGMVTMDDSLFELVNQGLITKEEARYRAEEPKRFE